MNFRAFCFLLVLIISCTACSHPTSEAKPISVEKQSYVRWHEKENELEVYVPVANATSQTVSFEAALIFRNARLQESLNFKEDPLEEDDRGNNTPFELIANKETVFKRTYKTLRPITKAMLEKGVGIRIVMQDRIYATSIKYSEVK